MAKNKYNLDFFSIDVIPSRSERRVQNLFGLQGIGMIILIKRELFSDGFYLKWDNDVLECLADEAGINEAEFGKIFTKIINANIFDKELFTKYRILTSVEIQENYITATVKRTRIPVNLKYWLAKESLLNRQNIIKINNTHSSTSNIDVAEIMEEESNNELNYSSIIAQSKSKSKSDSKSKSKNNIYLSTDDDEGIQNCQEIKQVKEKKTSSSPDRNKSFLIPNLKQIAKALVECSMGRLKQDQAFKQAELLNNFYENTEWCFAEGGEAITTRKHFEQIIRSWMKRVVIKDYGFPSNGVGIEGGGEILDITPKKRRKVL